MIKQWLSKVTLEDQWTERIQWKIRLSQNTLTTHIIRHVPTKGAKGIHKYGTQPCLVGPRLSLAQCGVLVVFVGVTGRNADTVLAHGLGQEARECPMASGHAFLI